MNPDTWHPAYKLAFSFDIVPDSYPYLFSNKIYHYVSSSSTKYPIVSIEYILQQIMQTHGYVFDSNIDSWKNKYLSINSADATPTEDDSNVFQKLAISNGVGTVNGTQFFTWNIQKNSDSNLSAILDQGQTVPYILDLVLFGPKTINITIRRSIGGGIATGGTTATFYVIKGDIYTGDRIDDPWTIGVVGPDAPEKHTKLPITKEDHLVFAQ
jgi:hypothetical protein